MTTVKEYPIDEEFWKWWDNYWGKEDSDISIQKENTDNGTDEIYKQS